MHQPPLTALLEAQTVISTLRLSFEGQSERSIQDAVAMAFERFGRSVIRERKLGLAARADLYLPDSQICIELKKARPRRASLVEQIGRYCALPTVAGVLVVLERSILLEMTIGGKPVRVLSLRSLWGVAV